MFNRILVVCTGNICRSPFGEEVLRQLCPKKEISSAGTGALVGHSADKMAILIADQMGFDLTNHKARQLTREICCKNELILVMEDHHKNYIASLAPEVTGRTMLFGQWLTKQKIDDPYRHGEEFFVQVFTKIKNAATLWQQKLD